MKSRKQILIGLFMLALLLSCSRFLILGSLIRIGLVTFFIGTVFHSLVHIPLIKGAEKLTSGEFWMAAISHLTYVNLFLFQFEQDAPMGKTLPIEFFTGVLENGSHKSIATVIFGVSLLVYIVLFFMLFLTSRGIKAE